jgi:hypothetical protein
MKLFVRGDLVAIGAAVFATFAVLAVTGATGATFPIALACLAVAIAWRLHQGSPRDPER